MYIQQLSLIRPTLAHSIICHFKVDYWMCATELFAIHASVLNRKTSLHAFIKTTKSEPKPRFFGEEPTETYHQ